MKKLIISCTFILLLVSGSLRAQTAIDDLYDEYADQKGFTSININPAMFQMISGMDMNDSSEQAQDAQDVMKKLTGLKMLVYEPENGHKNRAFLDDVKALTEIKGYSEMMSVKDGNDVVKFLAKDGKDGKIPEMLMIVYEDNEVVIMSMTGDMDLKTFTEISKSMGMKELENIGE